jgi:hypothetical protein
MVARQRFQDTMVTLRSTIQAEYGEVRTNINERLGTKIVNADNVCANDGKDTELKSDVTGNSKCLAVGKLIQFTENSQDVKISYVVSTSTDDSLYLNKSDEAALRSMPLRLVDSSMTSDAAILPKTVRIEWGGDFSKGWTIPPAGSSTSPASTKAIAILHSPISGAVLVFALKGTASITSIKSDPNNTPVNQPVAIMIKNAQVGFKGAAICIDSGASSSAVRMAIPADNFYVDNNGTSLFDNTSLSPVKTKMQELCSI